MSAKPTNQKQKVSETKNQPASQNEATDGDEELRTIKYDTFVGAKAGQLITIAGVLKAIDDKPTPYGVTVKHFRGEFGVKIGDRITRGRFMLPPINFGEALVAKIKALGEKWESLEFVATTKHDASNAFEAPSFIVAPRVEQDRINALLNSVAL